MPQRKIDVIFHVDNYDDEIGTRFPITRITSEQLKKLQESLATAQLPTDSCLCSMSVKYEDNMSFMNGGARRNRITGRQRTVEISDLFYAVEYSEHQPVCGGKSKQNELAMTRHCAQALRAGKCRDEFMRRTIGAILFPRFYANEKQK